MTNKQVVKQVYSRAICKKSKVGGKFRVTVIIRTNNKSSRLSLLALGHHSPKAAWLAARMLIEKQLIEKLQS